MIHLRWQPLSRRTLLRGLAGGAAAGIALPFLDAMAPRQARAQAAMFPKRFIGYLKPNGMAGYRADAFGDPNLDQWTPKTVGPNWVMTAVWRGFTALKPDITVLTGVHNRLLRSRLAHDAQSTLFTPFDYVEVPQPGRVYDAMGGGRSLDLAIADKIQGTARFHNLAFGVYLVDDTFDSGLYNRYCSYTASGVANPPEEDPRKMFTRLFAQGVPAPGGGAADPNAALERLRRQNRSILDGVKANVDILKAKLDGGDRAKLDQHLTSIRDIETRLTAAAAPPPTGTTCKVPPQPPALPYNRSQPNNMKTATELQTQMLVMAIACDLTRVATFSMCGGLSETTYPFAPGVGSSGSIGHHELTHNGPRPATWAVDEWQMTKIAELIAGLKNIPEGGKTALDSTVVLAGSDSAAGWHHNEGGWYWGAAASFGEPGMVHQPKGSPLDWAFVLAGGTHYFKHGTHVRYKGGRVTHERLLRACYEACTGLEGAASAEFMAAKYRDAAVIPGVRGDIHADMFHS